MQPWRTTGLLGIAILIASASQLSAPSSPTLATVGFGLAAIVLLWGLGGIGGPIQARPRRPAAPVRALVRPPLVRVGCAVGAVGCLAAAYAAFADNTFTTRGLVCWGLGLLCFLAAVWQRKAAGSAGEGPEAGDRFRLRPGWHELGLAAVLLLAVFFRFHNLAVTPIEMTSDHAEKLVDVHEVLSGERPIFFPRNTGREAFQFYLTAALIRFTPLELGHLALKVGTAIFGVVAVWFTILLGSELYNRQVGLLAGALLAMNGWHVAITRIGLRFTFTAAFATPVLLYAFRALRDNRRRDWILAGAFLGVGLHTYVPMRIVPLLLLALCLVTLVLDWSRRRRERGQPPPSLSPAFWVNAAIGGATSLALFLPLLRYMHDEPAMFWFRAASRALPDGRSWTETLTVLAGNLQRAAMMFSFIGDTVAVNTVAASPFLDWVTGGLFVLGLVALLWSALRWRDRRPLLLLTALVFLLLPSVLSIEFPRENPSAVRTGGAPPVVAIIAALPLYLWASAAWRAGSRRARIVGRTAAAAGLAAVLGACFAYNYHWYFVRYHEQYIQRVTNSRNLGAVVRDFVARGGSMENVFHIPWVHWVDSTLIGVHAGDVTWNQVLPHPEVETLPTGPGPMRLFLLHPEDTAALAALEAAYPTGSWRLDDSTVPDDPTGFVVFEVPAVDRSPAAADNQ